MQIAVLSDIHGNYIAFQACLDACFARGIDTFFLLGDYIGEFVYPQKTMEMLYWLREHYRCVFIRGNKEDYWIRYRESGETGWEKNNSTTGSMYYAYHNLTGKDIDFFQSLPHVRELPELQTVLCHGSPRKINEKMLPDSDQTRELMLHSDMPLIVCGHTHVQTKFSYGKATCLNPGSVGVSLNAQSKAQFMILHEDNGRCWEEFISIPYDTGTVIRELQESGLDRFAPGWYEVTKHLLETGKVPHGDVLERVMALCTADRGFCNWPDIPEQYWQQALEEMLK